MAKKKIREAKNYFGMTAQTFTVLGAFDCGRDRLKFCFETWANPAAFEAGDAPLKRLAREFVIEADELARLREVNPDVFASIDAAALSIAGLETKDWELEYLSINACDKVLIVVCRNFPLADDRRHLSKTGENYDKTVADNLELIASVIGLTVAYGKQHDEFLAVSETGEV